MSTCPAACAVPAGSLLAECRRADAYVDCYQATFASPASLADFIEAFYTSRVFKIERRILGLTVGKGASDDDACRLARHGSNTFAIWTVAQRLDHQILLSAGRTRSWLMVDDASGATTSSATLFFGSAVMPARGNGSGMGFPFDALLGFHKLYSRALLASAMSRLPVVQATQRDRPGTH